MFWAPFPEIMDIYDSLTDALSCEGDGNITYEDHLPLSLLETEVKFGKYKKGKLSVNKYHAQEEAFVSHSEFQMEESESGDILVCGMTHRNRATHGDIVAVELLPKSQWKKRMIAQKNIRDNEPDEIEDVMPTGKVVGIFQRQWKDVVASFPQDHNELLGDRILVIPYDYRIPKIRIRTKQAASLKDNRILVRIDTWPKNSQYPNGHFVKALGMIGDVESEIEVILIDNDVVITPFSQGILNELPSSEKEWKIPMEEISKRRDLRDTRLVFSIDPKGCEDVDDALSVHILPDGNIELGVHIADVTYFVPSGSLTDREAKNRATSVYLADRRIDMLPPILSAGLCSLLSGVDRCAVSVIWVVHHSTFEVLDVWYGRTIIRSAYKLSYECAQDIIDIRPTADVITQIGELKGYSKSESEGKISHLRDHLSVLTQIAHSFLRRRQTDGALQLESNEVQFEFKETKLDDIKPKEALEVHETIAECMIFANHWVAKKISTVFPHAALLRYHPPPRPEKFEQLELSASSLGWKIDFSSNKSLADSLDSCIHENDPTVNQLLRMLATYAMVNAFYFSTGSLHQEDWNHYGLALDRYTHFTSPIRRYADVIVHRLLLTAIETEEGDHHHAKILPNSELQEQCEHINNRNRAAQQVERSSRELYQSLYFSGRSVDDPICKVDSVIFTLKPNGFLVYVPAYGLKGPVYLLNKENQVCWINDSNVEWRPGEVTQRRYSVSVQTSDGEQTYRLFDHVTVLLQLAKSHAHSSSLQFSLLHRSINPNIGVSSQITKMDVVKEVKSTQPSSSNVNSYLPSSTETATRSSLYQLFESLYEIALSAP